MFCPKCGIHIADGSEYCVKCGAKIPADSPAREPYRDAPRPADAPKPPAAPPKQRWTLVDFLILGVVILIAVIGLYSCFGPEEPVSRPEYNRIFNTRDIPDPADDGNAAYALVDRDSGRVLVMELVAMGDTVTDIHQYAFIPLDTAEFGSRAAQVEVLEKELGSYDAYDDCIVNCDIYPNTAYICVELYFFNLENPSIEHEMMGISDNGRLQISAEKTRDQLIAEGYTNKYE